MTLDRTDYTPAILAMLKQRGPSRLSQIVLTVAEQQNFRAVDYDVRRLRMAGRIRSVKGLWELSPATRRRPAAPEEK